MTRRVAIVGWCLLCLAGMRGRAASEADHSPPLPLPLPEPERDHSGYRRYGADAVVELVKIRTLAEAGFPDGLSAVLHFGELQEIRTQIFQMISENSRWDLGEQESAAYMGRSFDYIVDLLNRKDESEPHAFDPSGDQRGLL